MGGMAGITRTKTGKNLLVSPRQAMCASPPPAATLQPTRGVMRQGPIAAEPAHCAGMPYPWQEACDAQKVASH